MKEIVRTTRYSILAISLLGAISANAAIATHGDSGSFSVAATAAGVTSVTIENFGSETPGLLSMDTSIPFNGFTASASNTGSDNMGFYIASSAYSGANFSPFTTSQYLGWGEESEFGSHSGAIAPDITLTFGPNVRAFGFDYLDSDPTDETRIFVNGVEVGLGGHGAAFAATTNTGFNGTTYFGIVSNTDITEIKFIGTGPGGFVDAQGLDNVQVGTIPGPSSAFLGLLGFAALLRRRRS